MAGLACVMTAASAVAQEHPVRTPHVRGDANMQRLIADAARRSPAIEEWLARLEALDVIVYVRTKRFAQFELDGHVALLATAGSHRYLIIELACGRSELTQMTTLGHELFHAIEIAEEPAAVSPDALAALYARIGTMTGDTRGQRTFETGAAAAAGQRARRQLLTSTRHGNGT